MPLTSFLFGKNPQPVTLADTLVLDAATQVVPSRAANVTKFPIEEGSLVSDHLVLENMALQIEGLISEAPISTIASLATGLAGGFIGTQVGGLGTAAVAGAIGLVGSIFQGADVTDGVIKNRIFGDKNYPKKAYEWLLRKQEARLPFDIVTGFKKYTNMVITNISAPQTAADGSSLRFSMTAESLQIVSTQTVQIPENILSRAAASSAASKGNVGRQVASPASDDASSKSTILFDLFN